MSELRRARHWMVIGLGLLLCAGAIGIFAGRGGELPGFGDDSAAGSSTPRWPADLRASCNPPSRPFSAARPTLVASARSRHFAVAAYVARDQKEFVLCFGTLLSEPDFASGVRPLRDAPRGTTVLPFQRHTASDESGSAAAILLVTRLPVGVARVILWPDDGRTISLEPQGGRWIAAIVETIPTGRQTLLPEPGVRRLRYMSPDDRVLGEWVASGVRANPRVPRLQQLPMLDVR